MVAGDPEYVRILTRDADGFDDMVRELLPPKTAEAALTLKPYLFVESNPSAETVVAHCMRYDVAGASGCAGKKLVYHENPIAVLTQAPVWSTSNQPLRPGDRRVSAVDASFAHRDDADDPYWVPGYREGLERDYPAAFVKHMRISFDAVILEDGSLFGPDECGFAEHFSMYVAAEREIFRRIVEGAGAGPTLDGVIQALRDESSAIRAKNPALRDDSDFCNCQSIGEAYGLWSRHGHEAFLRLAREMAGREPFSVRRRRL